jgi:LacI family transcriptional regulator, galactose operon repressor
VARSRRKRVLVFESQFRGFWVDAHIAILEYARMHGDWEVMTIPTVPEGQELEVRNALDMKHAEQLHPDGVVGWFGRRARAKAWSEFPIPVVSIYGGRAMFGLPQAGANEQAVGKMAAEHLISCGFEHFGFYGFGGRGTPSTRWFGFRQELRARGFSAERLMETKPDAQRPPEPATLPDAEAISAWLKRFPKPVGIFANNDVYAGQICDVCRELGIAVPEEVAILGVGDDRLRCLSHHVPLSSIHLSGRAVGHAVATLLDSLMRSRHPVDKAVLIPPEGVTVRMSTDTIAVSDPNVVAAVRFIRENACRRITLEEILAQTSVCQSLLNRKFRKLLGRTPFQEVRRVRIERAKLFLRDSSKTIDEIGRLCAFRNGFQLSREFKNTTGMRPGAYRKQFQQR